LKYKYDCYYQKKCYFADAVAYLLLAKNLFDFLLRANEVFVYFFTVIAGLIRNFLRRQ